MRFFGYILLLVLFSCEENPSTPCVDCDRDITTPFKSHTFNLSGEKVVAVGSAEYDMFCAFYTTSSLGDLEFNIVRDRFPIVLKDQYDNHWSIFGECLDGMLKGECLKPLIASKGYWSVWTSIYPNSFYNGLIGNGNAPPTSLNWSIDSSYVNRGATTGSIKELLYPKFNQLDKKKLLVDEFSKLDDDIIVVSYNGESKIYPIKILNYHEVVNDVLGGVDIILSYSPFSRATAVWTRGEGVRPPFAASGLVYNNNMLLIDQLTNSYWSQLKGSCVNGPLIKTEPQRVSYIHTKLSTWADLADSFKILSYDTSFSFDYNINPIIDYDNADELPYQVSYSDSRNHEKYLVWGCADGENAYVFDKSSF